MMQWKTNFFKIKNKMRCQCFISFILTRVPFEKFVITMIGGLLVLIMGYGGTNFMSAFSYLIFITISLITIGLIIRRLVKITKAV